MRGLIRAAGCAPAWEQPAPHEGGENAPAPQRSTLAAWMCCTARQFEDVEAAPRAAKTRRAASARVKGPSSSVARGARCPSLPAVGTFEHRRPRRCEPLPLRTRHTSQTMCCKLFHKLRATTASGGERQGRRLREHAEPAPATRARLQRYPPPLPKRSTMLYRYRAMPRTGSDGRGRPAALRKSSAAQHRPHSLRLSATRRHLPERALLATLVSHFA